MTNRNADAAALQTILDTLCEIDINGDEMNAYRLLGKATMMAKLALGSRADETAYKAMHARTLAKFEAVK